MTITNEQIQALKAANVKPVGKFILVMSRWHHIWHGEAQHTEPRKPLVKLYSEETVSKLLAERDADKALIAEQAKSIDFLKEQLAQLANFNPDWDKLEAATDSLREHMAELTEANKRIAELEQKHCGSALMDREQHHVGVVNNLLERIAELSSHLRNAHAFIENTEAFGGEAATGIISCGGAEWNIDASKAALSNSPDISSTTPHVGEWAIDHSAGRPILTYKNCSVIEAEDAEFVLSLISQHQRNNELEARTLTVKLPYSIPCPTAPETIWLQTNGADSEESRWPTSDDDVSWCRDKIFTNDTLYVRADCAAAGITLVVGE